MSDSEARGLLGAAAVSSSSPVRRHYGSASAHSPAAASAGASAGPASAAPRRLVVDELAAARSRPRPHRANSSALTSVPSRLRSGGLHRGMGVRQLLRYYIPVCSWLPHYSVQRQLLPDVLAGLTIAVMLVPQSIAYAAMAGLPPLVGLYTSFWPSLVYFFLGTSRQMHVGPESTTVILLSHALARYAGALAPRLGPLGEDDPSFVPLLLAQTFRLTFLSGLMALLMGLLRLGFVDSVLSQPILQGFVFSTALLLITDQFPKLLGLSMAGQLSPDARALDKWAWSFSHLHQVHWPTALVSLASIALIGLIRLSKARGPGRQMRWVQNFPELLLVLLLATCVSSLAHLDQKYNVAVLGAQPQGFAPPRWWPLGIMGSSGAEETGAGEGEQSELLTSALSVALIGFINSGIVSKLFAQGNAPASAAPPDAPDGSGVGVGAGAGASGVAEVGCPRHDVSSNRELVALGVSNVFASFFGAFPAYGSMLRTKVAADVGASSQVGSLVCSLVVGVVILALLPLFSLMPKAVISSMIVVIAAALLDLAPIRALVRVGDLRDLALYAASILVTFLFGLDVGLFFSFAACLMMLVRQTNQPAVTLLGRREDGSGLFQALEPEEPQEQEQGLEPGHEQQQRDGPVDGVDSSSSISSSPSGVGSSAHVRTPSVVSKVRSVLIVKLDGALHFANARSLQQSLERVEKFSDTHAHPASSPHPFFDEPRGRLTRDDDEAEDAEQGRAPIHVSFEPVSSSHGGGAGGALRSSVVVDLSDCTSMDSTAVLSFISQLEQYDARGLLVMLVLRRTNLHDKLMAAGAARCVVAMFRHLHTAVTFAENQRGAHSANFAWPEPAAAL